MNYIASMLIKSFRKFNNICTK